MGTPVGVCVRACVHVCLCCVCGVRVYTPLRTHTENPAEGAERPRAGRHWDVDPCRVRAMKAGSCSEFV